MKIVYTCLQVYHGRPWGALSSICLCSCFITIPVKTLQSLSANSCRWPSPILPLLSFLRVWTIWNSLKFNHFWGVYPRNEMTETFKNCIWNVNSTCIVLTVGSWYIHVFLLRKDEKKRNIYNWYWGLSIYIQ